MCILYELLKHNDKIYTHEPITQFMNQNIPNPSEKSYTSAPLAFHSSVSLPKITNILNNAFILFLPLIK